MKEDSIKITFSFIVQLLFIRYVTQRIAHNMFIARFLLQINDDRE